MTEILLHAQFQIFCTVFHFLFLIVVDLLPAFFFRYEFIKTVTENERVKIITIISAIINSNEFSLFQTN